MAGAVLLQTGIALGQTPVSTAASEIGEIVVEAQRRSERLIDVPASVVAVANETVTASGAKDLADVSRLAPNVNVSNSSGLNASVSIRGVGTSSRNIGFDTRVGVYVDGVYLGQSPALNQELLDLDRVEVLRGPQGALFGKNTVAGAINLITAKPGKEFEGEASGELSNLSGRFVAGDVNVPLGETAAVKLAASYRTRDGYVENLYPPYSDGKYAGGAVDNAAWRVQGRWDVLDNLEILGSVDGLRSRNYSATAEAETNTFATGPDLTAPSERSTNYNLPSSDFRDLYGGSLRARYNLGNDLPSIVSITAYRDSKLSTAFDVDYSPVNLVYVDYHDRYKQYTQELQLVSPDSGRLKYILGLYYYWQDGSTDREAIAGVDAAQIGLVPGARLPNRGDLITRNSAIFGNVTYDILEALNFGIGFRASREQKSVEWSILGNGIPQLGLATGDLSRSRVDHDISPTATLTYKISPNADAYARYATGYKSGGYNLEFVSTAAFPGNLEFRKETVKNYEAGFKGAFWNGRLQLSSAIFQADYSNYQVSQLRDLGGGRSGFVIGNAASARTRGIELETALKVTERLTLSANAAALDAVFRSFPGGGLKGNDVSGHQLPFAPKFSASLSADYLRSLPGTPLNVRSAVFVTYTGTQYASADNFRVRSVGQGTMPWGFLPDYALVDLRLGLEDAARRWDVSIFARNLFNKTTPVSYSSDFFGTLTETFNAPRFFGVDVHTRF